MWTGSLSKWNDCGWGSLLFIEKHEIINFHFKAVLQRRRRLIIPMRIKRQMSTIRTKRQKR